MRFTVVMLMLIAPFVVQADPHDLLRQQQLEAGGYDTDAGALTGWDWIEWTDKERHWFIMGFMVADFKVIEYLSQESKIRVSDAVVDEVLLDNTSVHQIKAGVTAWYVRYSDQGGLDYPVWYAVFSAKSEGGW